MIMTIEACRRVLWRLEESKNWPRFQLKDLNRAIMLEIGLDNRTIKKYIKRMIQLGLIKRYKRWNFEGLVSRHETF